jgi:hypothetical protein
LDAGFAGSKLWTFYLLACATYHAALCVLTALIAELIHLGAHLDRCSAFNIKPVAVGHSALAWAWWIILQNQHRAKRDDSQCADCNDDFFVCRVHIFILD